MKKSTLFFLLSFLILNLSSLVYGSSNSNSNMYTLSLTSKNFDDTHTTYSYQEETKINTLPVKKDTTNYYNWIESKSLSSAIDLAFFMLEQ
ncbi:MAG: hypothetical protein ACTSVB_02040, partial [Candidatus Heimdallarchaeaceae archaeon]